MEGGEVEPPYEDLVDAVEGEQGGPEEDETEQIWMDWYEKR